MARIIGPVVLPEAQFRPGRLTELRASWIVQKGIRAHTRQSMSMDLRRPARPERKTSDIPPDRMETRPEPEEPEPGARRPGGPGPGGPAEDGG